MAFKNWDYEFEGLFTDPNQLREYAGVYVIWCDTGGEKMDILDVGESDNVRVRVLNHDRANCWSQNCQGTIYYSATYITSLNEREDLERRIRNSENVACGER